MADSVSVPRPGIPGLTMPLLVVQGTYPPEWHITTWAGGMGFQGNGYLLGCCHGDDNYPPLLAQQLCYCPSSL